MRGVHAIHAAKSPDRLALVDEHRRLTYLEADQEIAAVAVALRDHLGASRHAPVAVCMENRVEYATTWLALFRLGITCAHLSRHSTTDEIEPLLERAGARILVVSEETLEPALQLRRRRPDLGLRLVVVGGRSLPAGVHGFEQIVARGRALAGAHRIESGPRSENVVYTSGTTGRPKGAVRNFASIGVLELLAILDRLPLSSGDNHLVVAPMYHSSGQVFTLLNAALGSTVYLQSRFDAEQTLRMLHEHDIDNVFMVPTMTRRVLDLPDPLHRRYPAPGLRALISGAAPFDEALRLRAIERFGAGSVFDFYGATELGWVTLVDGHEMLSKPGSLGRAIPGQEIAIFDEQGRQLGPKEIGMIYTRSTQLMQGYMRDEDATARSRRGAWLTVEDLGYLDEQGSLFLTGRARDMVISGGVNIYPVEVENVLAHHPAITEVSVIGLPDPAWGERLVAVYVAERELDPDELRQWAKQRMASYKVPRQWQRIDELPRNPTGKVLKHELQATLTAADVAVDGP